MRFNRICDFFFRDVTHFNLNSAEHSLFANSMFHCAKFREYLHHEHKPKIWASNCKHSYPSSSGPVAQLIASPTAYPGAVSLILARSYTLVEIDHEFFFLQPFSFC